MVSSTFSLFWALSAAAVSHSAAFVHPGVLVSGDQLQYVKTLISSGDPVVTNAYQKALVSTFSKLDYKVQGPPVSQTIECGPYSKPDFGCTWESEDSSNAYLQALLFALNGTQQYANNAISILNSYAYNLKKYNNSNAPLQSAWSAGKWTRAAELLRHTPGSGYLPVDQQAISDMLYRVTLPLIINGGPENGNWELSMIEAQFGLAVYSENQTLFDHAASMWRQRTPAYFYDSSLDGDKPVPPPRGALNWFNQTVFNASTNGVCQETCRDLTHTQMGYAACMNGAETARIQGVDLFQEESQRLVGASEFLAYYLLKNPVPDIVCNGTGLNYGAVATMEIGYNNLHNRLNQSLPFTLSHLLTQVRTMQDESMMLMVQYETLTHAVWPSA